MDSFCGPNAIGLCRMKPICTQSLIAMLAAAVLLPSGCRAIRGIAKNRDSITARRMSRQGIQAMREGNWNSAEKLFNAALAASKSDDRAHRGLAESMWQRDEQEAAIKHMEQAVLLSAGEPKLMERLGRMYLEVGRFEDANQQCMIALEANRDSAAVWALRGDCLLQQDRLEDALAAYHRALALQPDYRDVQLRTAEIYRSQGRYDRLLATLDRLQESAAGEDIPYRVNILRGIAMRELSRGQEALLCFQRAAQTEPGLAEPHLMIASLCLDGNDIQAAQSAVDQAKRLDPEAVRAGKWIEQLENHQPGPQTKPVQRPSLYR
jgi:tetratricopeptide (TPR) repeat protein